MTEQQSEEQAEQQAEEQQQQQKFDISAQKDVLIKALQQSLQAKRVISSGYQFKHRRLQQ